MKTGGAKIWFGLRAKVILPVVVGVIVLMAITTSFVAKNFRQQLLTSTTRELTTVDAMFTLLRDSRDRNLQLRYQNVVKEPRIKTVSGLIAKDAEDAAEKTAAAKTNNNASAATPPSVRRAQSPLAPENTGLNTSVGVIGNLVREEHVADAILLAPAKDLSLQSVLTEDPAIDTAEFKASCAALVNSAIQGDSKVEIQRNGTRLYDVVAIPIHDNYGGIIGALAFGVENDLVREFDRETGKKKMSFGMAIFANGNIVATSTNRLSPLAHRELAAEAARWAASHQTGGDNTRDFRLEGKHYLGQFNHLPNGVPGTDWSYVILSSYEEAWLKNQETQSRLIVFSLFAILIGALVVGLIVRQATRPLRELQASAEAIGRGDFSQRVPVRTRDELGALAQGFNHMTESLKVSREQLENTVERLETTQAQLVQSEKLSGIGQFIAGVAHELNNPLTSVMGFSELLQNDTLAPQQREFISLIHKNAQRCQRIVQSLLSFARRHQPERKPTNINHSLEAAIDIIGYQLRTSNIDLKLELDPHLPNAMLDIHQMQQVFVNIINNARQAIEAHATKGWIRVATTAAGANIRVTIEDSGPGITPENLTKIFDPFFTTKEVGKGTGLGLSLCYGIIKEHGGNITPSSHPGKGATFTIELPATSEARLTKPLPAAPKSANTNEGHGKKILIIDDEEPIQRMVREALTRQGYQVDVASDGETGLNRLRQTDYDATLCDWRMPGLNGQQVYEQTRATRPALARRFIFITGDLISEKTRQFLADENKICLPKPFTLSEFRDALKKVLAE